MNALTANLTEQQAEFVRLVATGKCVPSKAAELANYSYPDQSAQRLMALPHIVAAIQNRMRRWLQGDAGPRALQVLYDLMVDDKMDPRVRRACAKDLSQVAGYVPPKAADNKALQAKSFADMSADDLRQASRDYLKELSDRAVTIIDNAPSQGASDDQAFDLNE